MAEKTKETKETKNTVKTVTYQVQKGKNFNGFIHPKTRKFVKAKEGKFTVKETDKEAIAILEAAADLFEV